MANAFINGVDSEKQTASVKSTLSNAFKKNKYAANLYGVVR